MAHIKLVSPMGWDFDRPICMPIKASSRGLIGADRQEFVKMAGSNIFLPELDRIKFAKDEYPLHAIALGAYEAYGFNRNGDGFDEATCRQQHPTFVKFARFFRNHRNKPDKGHPHFGIIKASAYNPVMRRVELLIALNAEKSACERNGGFVADQELEKLASDGDLPLSMACLTNPEYPILTKEHGYLAIRDVRRGMYVWTKQGRWRRVTQINRRRFTGEVFEFHVNGLPFPLELTADHPMWAKIFAGSRATGAMKTKARRYFRDTKAFNTEIAGWALAKDIGVGDRFFYRPVSRYHGYGRITSKPLAAVMGYYTAEGNFSYNGERACTTQFTCNLADSLPRVLPSLISQMYPDITVDVHPHASSEAALVVEIHSTPFSEFLRKYVGSGCKHKTIAPEIFNAERDIKLAYLGAWLDGDGWPDKKGIHWSTASMNLALQGRDLLASLGIPASIYRIDHAKCRTSGKPGSGIEYTLNVPHLDAWQLAEYSSKIAGYQAPVRKRDRPASMRMCPDGTYALRVSRVTSRYVSDCETYNIEVEEDESYSAAGLISHNCRVPFDVCSWCKNQASRREEYCGHEKCAAGGCKKNLTRLVKVAGDVHHLGVFNPGCVWFDISKVFRPADRIAYGAKADWLTKAAGDGGVFDLEDMVKMAADVTAPLEVVLFQDGLPGQWTVKIAAQVKLAYGLAAIEEVEGCRDPECYRAFAPSIQAPFPVDTLGEAGTEKSAAALGALADRKIVLPLRDFARFVGCEHIVKEAAERLPGVYGRMIADDSLERRIQQNKYPLAEKLAASRQRAVAGLVASEYSLEKEAVEHRGMLAALRGCGLPAIKTFLEKDAADNLDAEQLARDYAIYQTAALARIASFDQNFVWTARAAMRQNHVM